jgi:hypothetical protein
MRRSDRIGTNIRAKDKTPKREVEGCGDWLSISIPVKWIKKINILVFVYHIYNRAVDERTSPKGVIGRLTI